MRIYGWRDEQELSEPMLVMLAEELARDDRFRVMQVEDNNATVALTAIANREW